MYMYTDVVQYTSQRAAHYMAEICPGSCSAPVGSCDRAPPVLVVLVVLAWRHLSIIHLYVHIK